MNNPVADLIQAAEEITDPITLLVKRALSDPGAPFEAKNIQLLAELRFTDPAGYQRARADLAKAKIQMKALEKVISHVDFAEPAKSPGVPMEFPDISHWPDPVDGAQLFTEIVLLFRKYLVLPPYAAEAMALWVLFSHTHECWSISPRLALISPEKRCGKTTALSILQKLVPKPLPASNVTSAALFRSVAEWGPTLLIDEADTFLTGNEELRGILNSGHNLSQAFVVRTTPPDYTPARFPTWAPAAIAMIGHLPDTLTDRSIVINLKRKRPTDDVKRFRIDRAGELEALGQKIARWVSDNRFKIAGWDGTVPQLLNDRAADNWRPLLAIAHAMGPEAFQMAQDAAVGLSRIDDEGSVAILLLADIRSLFLMQGKTRLPTEDILAYLHDLESRPWPEYKNNKPLTESQLAGLLKDYGPKPKTRRFDDGSNRKGYALQEFQDAFERYLPVEPVTASQSSNLKGFMANDSVTGNSDVTGASTLKTAEYAICDDVTAAEGLPASELRPGLAPFDVPTPDVCDVSSGVEAMVELVEWAEDNAVAELGEDHGT